MATLTAALLQIVPCEAGQATNPGKGGAACRPARPGMSAVELLLVRSDARH